MNVITLDDPNSSTVPEPFEMKASSCTRQGASDPPEDTLDLIWARALHEDGVGWAAICSGSPEPECVGVRDSSV
jgi:hypothetical protein